ncbi:hypothetical protein ILUMI_07371 [Ignelater luminosus]|uniref:MARVEL domain-containing protein n=1 Tax=Ignelater luminosus TaxID=2038154 RepID=A0A8K0D9H3_IGNLU|nr:hypothetical protein ILUMI_07371 [Ignelater luminosus]
MGVRGLTTFIAKSAHKYLKRHELHGTYLVIDGNNIASHLYKWHCTKNDCFGGDYDRYAKVIYDFFKLLDDCNIIPLVIFDGGYEYKKFKTVFSRLRNKVKVVKNLNSVTQSSVSMFPLFLRDVFVDVVLKLKVKSVRCDFEADYEMACLARSLNCPVLSYDSDFYVFDVLYIPFSSFEMNLHKLKNSSGYCIHCSLYQVENFMNIYGGISQSNLPLVATLLGNDYVRRSLFRNFYKHIKSPKRKQVKSRQQRRIVSVIKWLQNETYDSAVRKILSRLKTNQRRFVAHHIKLITEGYVCKNSKYQHYLNIETLKEISQSNSSSCVDAVEILNDVNVESEGSSDDEDSDSSETSSNASDVSVNLIEPEEEFQESTEVFSTDKIPDWFTDKFRRCEYPSGFMDILSKEVYFFIPQLEDYSNVCSHHISVHLLSAINKILRSDNKKPLNYVARSENVSIAKYNTPFCKIKLPTLHEIPYIKSEDTRKILLSILNIKFENVVFLDNLPSNWQLYILSIIYWIKNANPAVTYCHVYSMVLCMLVLNIVDPQIGFCRSSTKFLNKFEKKLNAISNSVTVESNHNEDKSKVTFISLINSVTYNDCLLSMKELIKYFEMEEKMKTYLKLYDIHILDCFAQFQSCLLHIKHLNALLNKPYATCLISDFYNGTFLYNICANFMKRNNLDDYMADPGFPAQHTTTTTVTSNTRVQTNLRWDPSYIRRKEGILKAAQILLSFLGFICIQCTQYSVSSVGKWYSTVSMFAVWISAILLVFYLFHLIEKFYKIPWIKFELFYCGIIALCFLIASCMTATYASKAFQAGAFFGFSAMVAYTFDAYLKFLAMRSGELAQGERQISKETTTVTTPTY